MTVDLVSHILEFMKRFCTGWKARNCVCWSFKLAKTVLFSVFKKVKELEDAKDLGSTTTI